MKNKILLTITLLCALFALLLCGCNAPAEPTEATTEPTEPEPLDIYAAAVQAIEEAESLELDISAKKSVTVGNDTYRESAIQTLTYQDAGTEKMTAANTEILSFDGYSILIQECYSDGSVYYTVDGSNFMGEMSGNDFLNRFPPAALLDPQLYKTVETVKNEDGLELTFTGATGAESWLMLDEPELVEASGTISIDESGNLTSSSYSITYTYGGATISQSFIATPDGHEVQPIQSPTYPEDYVALEYPELPRLLEVACGYLSQGTEISSTITESYISQAGGVYRGQSYDINMSGKDDDLMVKSDCTVTIIDYSRGSDTTTHEQTELFLDGTYTLTENGKQTMENDEMAPRDMRTFVVNQLVKNVTLPQFLTEATASDLGSAYLFEFACSDDLALLLQDMAATTLFQDGGILNSMADSYETTQLTGYLAIDKYTGLPTATGYIYAGNHTIEGHPYTLSYQVDQSISLGSLSAVEAITGEAPQIPTDTPQPTPLFYHVTGENGEEMWLLGTIHVGDARTSNLPDAIYDALDASDALAVEFDIQAFDLQAEEDDELQALMADAFFYTDGTTLADHIDPELYEYALALMKATGSNNQNITLCKPFVLESSISNFYLQQAHLLTSDNGVDNRLLNYAKAAGKEILDVESGAFQIGMFAGYSEELQEMLLLSAAATDATEYWEGTVELYELWCAGNEAKLRAEVETDTSEMTEEELTLYNEYNDAMMIDRNEKMLEVAKEYLSGDKTVFYAVGLAHLISENGLVGTLREAGYTVELVTYGE